MLIPCMHIPIYQHASSHSITFTFTSQAHAHVHISNHTHRYNRWHISTYSHKFNNQQVIIYTHHPQSHTVSHFISLFISSQIMLFTSYSFSISIHMQSVTCYSQFRSLYPMLSLSHKTWTRHTNYQHTLTPTKTTTNQHIPHEIDSTNQPYYQTTRSQPNPFSKQPPYHYTTVTCTK